MACMGERKCASFIHIPPLESPEPYTTIGLPGHSPTLQAAPEAQSPHHLPGEGGHGEVASSSSPLLSRARALATILTRSPSSPGGPERPWAPVSPWKMDVQVRGSSEPPAHRQALTLFN